MFAWRDSSGGRAASSEAQPSRTASSCRYLGGKGRRLSIWGGGKYQDSQQGPLGEVPSRPKNRGGKPNYRQGVGSWEPAFWPRETIAHAGQRYSPFAGLNPQDWTDVSE